MHLATTALREFWGGSDRPLFLGRWCLPPDGARLAPDPWKDRAAVGAAFLEIETSVERLLPRLAAALNSAHGTSFSERYWSILAGPWLSRYLHFLKDRLERINAAFASEPDLGSTLLDPADYRTPADSLDFQDRGFTDAFNLQVFSQLIALREPARETRRCPAPMGRLRATRRGPWKPAADALMRGLSPEILIGELFPTRRMELALASALPGRAGFFLGRVPEPPETIDRRRRAALAEIRTDSPLESAAIALLPVLFPRLYLEGYAAARAAATAGWRRLPKAVLSATGWIFDEALKFAGAEFAESGTKLFGSQHGGGYGHDRDTPTERLERRGRDAWITWGWTDGEKTVPLPSPHTQRFAGLRDPNARDLYFSVNGFPLYPYLLYNFPIGRQIDENIELQGRFIKAVPEPARLRVRPYPEERGWRHRSRLESAAAGVRFDAPGSRFSDGLRSARVVVFDNVGTGFLEALASGVPTIAFQAKPYLTIRPAAEDDFRLLLDAKMLFTDPEAAAAHAGAVLDDPDPWWESEPVRKARERWSATYAGAAGPWLPAWKKFILDVLESHGQ